MRGVKEGLIALEIWEMYILQGKLIPTFPTKIILLIIGALPAFSRQFSIYNGVEPTEDE